MSPSSAPDVYALAASSNRSHWRSHADTVQSTVDGWALAAFRRSAADWMAGTNVFHWKLHHFLNSDPRQVVSGFEVQSVLCGGDERAAMERAYGPPWGSRRTAFEEELGSSRKAVYATLDAGPTAGTPGYGDYRLVFDPERLSSVLVFAHNTAQYYVSDERVLTSRMLTDVAGWESRGDVATVILGEFVREDPAQWADLLVRERHLAGAEYDVELNGEPHDLIEIVVRDGTIAFDVVSAIRCTNEYFENVHRKFEEEARAAFGSSGTVLREAETVLIEQLLVLAEDRSATFDLQLL